jgi:hypothetical protein
MKLSYDDCIDAIHALDVLIGAYSQECEAEIREVYDRRGGERYQRALALIRRIDDEADRLAAEDET